jgi:hypothetical protein
MFSHLKFWAAALLAGFALALGGCFMAPGKFTAELALTGPDSFTFRYDGEIAFLALSRLAQAGAAADAAFKAEPCYNDETLAERPCTAGELARQRAAWDAGAAERAAQAKKEAAQIAALMGGIDPTDPKAAEKLTSLLLRQKGWERVVHKGDGVFDVSYRASGTMGHDFTFPMIEGFPPVNPFVQVFLRKGGQVRINAPGFAAQNSDAGGIGALMGMGQISAMATTGASAPGESPEAAALKAMPRIDGTFTLRPARGMRILANNTDEGPSAGTEGEILVWRVTPRTLQAPTALIAAAAAPAS